MKDYRLASQQRDDDCDFGRNRRLRFLSCWTLLVVLGIDFSGVLAAQPNVLFIAIDDLRTDLQGLGYQAVLTPHLEALARTGISFSNHYVQVPTCGASRCALLRGKYPELKAYLSNQSIRDTHDQWMDTCLPAVFHRCGYQTLALGKVTHYPGGMAGKDWQEPPEELPGVWDRCWIPESPWRTAQNMMHAYANGEGRVSGQMPPWEASDGPDEAYPDAWIADEAIRQLGQLRQSRQPWLFCVGFFKPHLPFAAPRSWHDLSQGKISELPFEATAIPSWISGWHTSGEFMNNYRHPEGIDINGNAEYARTIRQAYLAAALYMDAQVGRVLAEISRLGLDGNTLIVVWSDHGFLLGEHSIWGKHCLYENALRSPLIIRTPKLENPGKTCAAIVETVDLFPTLLDMCGLAPVQGLDGQSLRPYLNNVELASGKPARSFWNGDRSSVRSPRWRLTSIPEQSDVNQKTHYELFDYHADPWETRNVAQQHPTVVAELSQYLGNIRE